ncbi:uncharacterized protein FPOAC1_013610 [Fusarium poae]|uniref:uncharacterized protein n=1 Tax=Fusarium poae TaxID=36050 RepID=UPI001D043DA5|nr:uncharacterized protein FPOAC1_013610 [Fusarium poae]KAG8664830.1 hypothetical protein FPOAC1_013610 [Fusarium poae]
MSADDAEDAIEELWQSEGVQLPYSVNNKLVMLGAMAIEVDAKAGFAIPVQAEDFAITTRQGRDRH